MTSQPRPSTLSSTSGLSYAASLKAVQNRLADPAFSTNPLRILALPRTNTSGSADNISLAAFFKSSPVQLSNASIPEIANVLEKTNELLPSLYTSLQQKIETLFESSPAEFNKLFESFEVLIASLISFHASTIIAYRSLFTSKDSDPQLCAFALNTSVNPYTLTLIQHVRFYHLIMTKTKDLVKTFNLPRTHTILLQLDAHYKSVFKSFATLMTFLCDSFPYPLPPNWNLPTKSEALEHDFLLVCNEIWVICVACADDFQVLNISWKSLMKLACSLFRPTPASHPSASTPPFLVKVEEIVNYLCKQIMLNFNRLIELKGSTEDKLFKKHLTIMRFYSSHLNTIIKSYTEIALEKCYPSIRKVLTGIRSIILPTSNPVNIPTTTIDILVDQVLAGQDTMFLAILNSSTCKNAIKFAFLEKLLFSQEAFLEDGKLRNISIRLTLLHFWNLLLRNFGILAPGLQKLILEKQGLFNVFFVLGVQHLPSHILLSPLQLKPTSPTSTSSSPSAKSETQSTTSTALTLTSSLSRSSSSVYETYLTSLCSFFYQLRLVPDTTQHSVLMGLVEQQLFATWMSIRIHEDTNTFSTLLSMNLLLDAWSYLSGQVHTCLVDHWISTTIGVLLRVGASNGGMGTGCTRVLDTNESIVWKCSWLLRRFVGVLVFVDNETSRPRIDDAALCLFMKKWLPKCDHNTELSWMEALRTKYSDSEETLLDNVPNMDSICLLWSIFPFDALSSLPSSYSQTRNYLSAYTSDSSQLCFLLTKYVCQFLEHDESVVNIWAFLRLKSLLEGLVSLDSWNTGNNNVDVVDKMELALTLLMNCDAAVSVIMDSDNQQTNARSFTRYEKQCLESVLHALFGIIRVHLSSFLLSPESNRQQEFIVDLFTVIQNWLKSDNNTMLASLLPFQHIWPILGLLGGIEFPHTRQQPFLQTKLLPLLQTLLHTVLRSDSFLNSYFAIRDGVVAFASRTPHTDIVETLTPESGFAKRVLKMMVTGAKRDCEYSWETLVNCDVRFVNTSLSALNEVIEALGDKREMVESKVLKVLDPKVTRGGSLSIRSEEECVKVLKEVMRYLGGKGQVNMALREEVARVREVLGKF